LRAIKLSNSSDFSFGLRTPDRQSRPIFLRKADGIRVPFSPEMNCLIGIQGSGKSSALESLRFALDISFGDESADTDYKSDLLDHVLKSGGKVIVERPAPGRIRSSPHSRA
jgi:hypothetical protein